MGKELTNPAVKPPVNFQTPDKEGRKTALINFSFDKIDEVQFTKYLSALNLSIYKFSVSDLYKNIQMRSRHLKFGNLSSAEIEIICEQIPVLNGTNLFHQCLYALTVFLTKADRNKAIDILLCFSRVNEKNIKEKVKTLIKQYNKVFPT